MFSRYLFLFLFANWLTGNGVALSQGVSHKFHATFFVNVLFTHLAWKAGLGKNKVSYMKRILKNFSGGYWIPKNCSLWTTRQKFRASFNQGNVNTLSPIITPKSVCHEETLCHFKKNVTNTSDYANGNPSCIGKHETCSHLNFPATGIRCQSLIGSMFFQVLHATETQNKNPWPAKRQIFNHRALLDTGLPNPWQILWFV